MNLAFQASIAQFALFFVKKLKHLIMLSCGKLETMILFFQR